MATREQYRKEATDTLATMSPVRRAAQLAAATIANFGNSATFGGVGALGDIARGTPWGTTGDQLQAQVQQASPGSAAASGALGYVAPGGLLLRGARAAGGGIRAALAAGSGVGAGGVRTAAKFAVPAAIAGGASGLAGDSVVPAATPETAVAAVDQALAQGRTAQQSDFITPRDQLNAFVSNVLNRGASINQVRALGDLVEGSPRPRTAKDTAIGTASQVADAQFQAALSAAEKLTDPAVRDAARQKAADQYFQRYAALSGVNLQGLTMADFLADQGE